ncbi:MAG: hypothetical protein Q8S02_07575 [Hydrogenophaga sp.]|nr:hypothetical protein [Hydrogenophaga sp.]
MNSDETQPDTTPQSAVQAIGPITREQLYELVWTKPMLRVGEMFGVSSSYMARVCTELRVPRPGLGYWTQYEMGRAPQRPALPPAEPGDLTEWKPGLSVGNTQRVARKQVAAAPTAGGQSVHRPGRSSKKAALPSVHPLLKDVRPLFLKSRERSTGLLHPFKRILVDIISSPALLDDALITANALFLALTKKGHRVMLAPGHLQMRRADVSVRDVQEPNSHHETPWSPDRPTVLFIGELAIGLTLFEMLESVETVYVNGTYIPMRELTDQQRRKYTGPRHWTSTKHRPSGRLILKAYCPSSHRVTWIEHWKESKPGELRTVIPKVVDALEASVPELTRLLAIAREQEEEAHRKWEEQKRVWEEQRQRERREDANKSAQKDLAAAIAAWDEHRKVEAYFSAITQAAESLESDTRDAVIERVNLAKGLLRVANPLEMLIRWKTPEERL